MGTPDVSVFRRSSREKVMVFYIIAGIFSAFGILFLLAKFDFQKVVWMDIPIDIASTVLLIIMFAGTFAGMMAAVIGGCIISCTLYTYKKLVGYKKPIRKKFSYSWVHVKPK